MVKPRAPHTRDHAPARVRTAPGVRHGSRGASAEGSSHDSQPRGKRTHALYALTQEVVSPLPSQAPLQAAVVISGLRTKPKPKATRRKRVAHKSAPRRLSAGLSTDDDPWAPTRVAARPIARVPQRVERAATAFAPPPRVAALASSKSSAKARTPSVVATAPPAAPKGTSAKANADALRAELSATKASAPADPAEGLADPANGLAEPPASDDAAAASAPARSPFPPPPESQPAPAAASAEPPAAATEAQKQQQQRRRGRRASLPVNLASMDILRPGATSAAGADDPAAVAALRAAARLRAHRAQRAEQEQREKDERQRVAAAQRDIRLRQAQLAAEEVARRRTKEEQEELVRFMLQIPCIYTSTERGNVFVGGHTRSLRYLLEALQITHRVVDLAIHNDEAAFVYEASGCTDLPQVFVNEQFRGLWPDVERAHEEGRLYDLLDPDGVIDLAAFFQPPAAPPPPPRPRGRRRRHSISSVGSHGGDSNHEAAAGAAVPRAPSAKLPVPTTPFLPQVRDTTLRAMQQHPSWQNMFWGNARTLRRTRSMSVHLVADDARALARATQAAEAVDV